jgi:hypothetical protein
VRERANKLAPSTIGPLLEERFTEDELKQIIAMLESPVNRKFQSAGRRDAACPGEKLVAECKPLIEPKLRALEQSRGQAAGPGLPAALRHPPASAAPRRGKK